MPRSGRLRSVGLFDEIRAGLGVGDTPESEARANSGYDVEEVCLYCLGMLQGEVMWPCWQAWTSSG
jgi:hypothetical protein